MTLAQAAEAYLRRTYLTQADDRQASMGLSYVTAETRDLAREIARFVEGLETGREASDHKLAA